MDGGLPARTAQPVSAEGRTIPFPDTRALDSIVASAFGLNAETLHRENRGTAPVALARQVAMYLAHTRLGLPYAAAGAVFGRDRTTAAHACRQIEERRDDPRLDSILDYLERAVDLFPARLAGQREP